MSTAHSTSLAARARAAATIAAMLLGYACFLTPPPASAHSSVPGTPSRLHVVRVSRSSFTVATNPSAHKYRLFASTNRHDLRHGRLHRAHSTRLMKSPRLTLSGLRYTTKPYYYRVEARNGWRKRFSVKVGPVGLQPPAPTSLVATSSAAGTSLSWQSAPATGFVITRATDPAMTQDVTRYTISGTDDQFTPYGLVPGTTYYFRVQALNDATLSPPSAVVGTMSQTAAQPVRVMTYNILEATADGRSEGGNHVAPWSQRRVGVANFINSADPDIVSIQEGGSWVDGVRGPRQVDDLVSLLGGKYSLASTEVPPNEPHYFRTGCYILYNSSEYTAVGQGGHFALGDTRWAAYQVLQNNATGAKFLMVAPHLLVTKGGDTDQRREDETRSMVSQATAYAAATVGPDLPIVYAGDFNSDNASAHKFNGPSDYLLPHGIDDAFDVAQSRTNARFDSANNYRTTPPAFGERIDYVFAPPGVAVRSWSMLLDLSHGQQVAPIPSDHNPVVADLDLPYVPSGGVTASPSPTPTGSPTPTASPSPSPTTTPTTSPTTSPSTGSPSVSPTLPS